MKTNVQVTSIDCFHGRVQECKDRQHALILSVMAPGIEYTGQELSHMTGLPPNTISARLFELRDALKVKRNHDKRLCPLSHVRVFTHRKLDGLSPSLANDAASAQAVSDLRQMEHAA